MRTAAQIALVLMGTGGLTAGTAMAVQHNNRCHEARARQDPDADDICRYHWSGGGGGFHGWSSAGRSGSGGSVAVSSVARGGFGASGIHFGGLFG